jgi:hypothetical protein
MPEQNDNAPELDECAEVFSMIFVANDKSAEVVKPCKEAFDFPSASVTPHGATVLGHAYSASPVGSDEFDAALFFEALVERVAVVGRVANQAIGRVVEHALVDGGFDEGYLVGRSTCNVNGDRKTMSVCDCHDLGALAALGFPHARPPFLAPVKEPSINASRTSIPPRSAKSSASASSTRLNVPSRAHCWKRRWQVWCGGYRSGKSFQGAPVRKIQRMPLSTSRGSRHGRPRPSGRLRGFGNSDSITVHCSFVRSIPKGSAITKPPFRYL